MPSRLLPFFFCPLVRGKIQLQSEAADAFFRRVRIKAINEIPADILKQAGL